MARWAAWAVLMAAGAACAQDQPSAAQIAAATRSGLQIELERTCARLAPNLNYIRVVERKVAGGWALYCVHPGFSSRTCDYGPFCPTLSTFIPTYLGRLKTGQVKRIGVWGDGPHADGTWFVVE